MTKGIERMRVTLNGVIEARRGASDWLAVHDMFEQGLTSTLRGIDGIAPSREADEQGSAYWLTEGATAKTVRMADTRDAP